eukprot:s2717_g3.t1
MSSLVRDGLPMVEWCTQLLGFATSWQLLQECCYRDIMGSACNFEFSEKIDAKCCQRDTEEVGFYGFLLPPRSFSVNGVMHALDPCAPLEFGRRCLFGYDTFQILGINPEEEMQAMGFIGTEQGKMVSISLPTSPPLMQPAQVNDDAENEPVFYHRLFHKYAEAIPQGIWELTHYLENRPRFRALRRAGRSCVQTEAALAGAMADTTAVPWLALRWWERGNGVFRSFVNLGARDGVLEDPLAPLLLDPPEDMLAVGVEMDPDICQLHKLNLPHVRLLCTQISKETMPEIIGALPRSFQKVRNSSWRRPRLDVLKVDLDGADCDIAFSFLSKVPAKVVVLEVFDGLPPPLRFALHEHAELASWGRLTIWGCSLSYQVRMLRPLGYNLIWYGAGNAIYAHRSVASQLGLFRLDEVDCYVKSVIMAMWPSGRRMRRWFYEEPLNETFLDAQRSVERHLKGRPYTLKV